MMDRNEPEKDPVIDMLTMLVPEAKSLSKDQKATVLQAMRRHLLQEQEEEHEAANLFRLEDTEALRQLIASLPADTPDEIRAKTGELGLAGDEAQMEISNWAFRHQAASGHVLLGDRLVPFRLVRQAPQVYLLLSLSDDGEIERGFSRAFGRPPEAFSGKALYVANERWSGWAWFLYDDAGEARDAAEPLRRLWKGMNQ